MLRSLLLCLLGLPFAGLNGQAPSFREPDMFPPALMQEHHIYQVNVFINERQDASADPGSGHIMRVVGHPRHTFFFDENGHKVRELQFHPRTGFLQSELRWKRERPWPNGYVRIRQDVRNYTYRSDDPADSLLVLHRIHYTLLGPRDQIHYEATYESDGETMNRIDSTSYDYDDISDQSTAHTVYRFYPGGQEETVAHSWQGRRELIWTSSLGRETHFVADESGRLKSTTIREPGMEHGWEHFYRKERLDSTWFYTHFEDPKRDPVGYGVRVFYDKSGRRVLYRTYLDQGRIEESLFEYLHK